MTNTPWRQTISIDEQLARRLIAQQFPDIQIKTLEYLGEGWDNLVYRVNDDLVFRFPRRNEFAIDCMRLEIEVMAQVAGLLPLPVSFPIYIGKPCVDYPHPFAGYYYLPGKPIEKMRLEELPDTDLLENLALFLKVLHAIPIEKIDAHIPYEPEKMNYPSRVEKIIEAVNIFEEPDKILKYVADLKSAFPVQDKHCIVHGDLHVRHILMNGNSMSGIIDWGDVQVNTPAVDLSCIYALFAREHHERFWKHYGPVSETMKKQAQFRAIYSNCLLGQYALDIKDKLLFEKCSQGLQYIVIARP